MTNANAAATIDAFCGEVLLPASEGYETGRQIYNKCFQRRPACIARCSGAADVRRALRFADEHGLEVTVRSGGHGHAGRSSIEGGLVIDLRLMRDVHVNPATATAWVGGGAQALDVIREAAEFGLVPVTGQASTIGVSGLVLGLGEGYLTPRHGFGTDSLLAAELVTAGGELLHISQASDAELFWALRGAGANFGVVTALKLQLHPLPEYVIGGFVTFESTDIGAVTQHLWTALETGSTGYFPHISYVSDVAGETSLRVLFAHIGPQGSAIRELNALRNVATPTSDDVKELSYVNLVEIVGASTTEEVMASSPRHAQDIYRLPFNVSRDHAVGVLLEHATRLPTNALIALWRTVPVEIANPGVAPRLPGVNVCILRSWHDEVDDETSVAWVGDVAADLLSTGLFEEASNAMNIVTFPGAQRARNFYGDASYRRLQALKTKHDPRNVFRPNFNVAPAEPGG